MKSMPYARSIVVGATSGIGYALARQLGERGCAVAAIGRREDRLRSLEAEFPTQVVGFAHDVRDYSAVPGLFQEITHTLGGLDSIFYVAGVMPEVAPDEFNFEKDFSMLEVNCAGAVAWLNQAAIRFGNVGAGQIVGVSSVAGDRGRHGQPVYNASKAFLNSYLESLRNRLSMKGVSVATIKPGPVETEMTEFLKKLDKAPKMLSAEKAASLILKKGMKNAESYLLLPHQVAFAIIRNIPSPVFRRLKI